MIKESDAFILVFSLLKSNTFETIDRIKNRIYSMKANIDFREIPIVVLGFLKRKQNGRRRKRQTLAKGNGELSEQDQSKCFWGFGQIGT